MITTVHSTMNTRPQIAAILAALCTLLRSGGRMLHVL